MIANQNFYDICFTFYPTASATAYCQKPEFFWAEHSAMAEHSATAEGEKLCLRSNTGHLFNEFLNKSALFFVYLLNNLIGENSWFIFIFS